MSTRYERGRDAEYRAIRELEAEGFAAFRTAGSHGGADVIGIGPDGIRLVQCKTWVTRPGSYATDIEKLSSVPLPPNSTAELWGRKVGQTGWAFQKLIKTTKAN